MEFVVYAVSHVRVLDVFQFTCTKIWDKELIKKYAVLVFLNMESLNFVHILFIRSFDPAHELLALWIPNKYNTYLFIINLINYYLMFDEVSLSKPIKVNKIKLTRLIISNMKIKSPVLKQENKIINTTSNNE